MIKLNTRNQTMYNFLANIGIKMKIGKEKIGIGNWRR
jgi:hypothetical protein